ncbi:hypothetical protein C2G38_2226322 [Gigaspora rosea]|uniref:SAP domain-containing protein n=1 Tax=Gigaspora rosea TaxID=44941 RepID=A0A397U6M1_9GLOM|nr:hypothetical protein C2G38_2226322 [Gigaspora rosea]
MSTNCTMHAGSWTKLTLTELKDLCAACGLSVEGNKEELSERLHSYFDKRKDKGPEPSRKGALDEDSQEADNGIREEFASRFRGKKKEIEEGDSRFDKLIRMLPDSVKKEAVSVHDEVKSRAVTLRLADDRGWEAALQIVGKSDKMMEKYKDHIPYKRKRASPSSSDSEREYYKKSKKKRKEHRPYRVEIFMDPSTGRELSRAITAEALGTSSQIAPPRTQEPLASPKARNDYTRAGLVEKDISEGQILVVGKMQAVDVLDFWQHWYKLSVEQQFSGESGDETRVLVRSKTVFLVPKKGPKKWQMVIDLRERMVYNHVGPEGWLSPRDNVRVCAAFSWISNTEELVLLQSSSLWSLTSGMNLFQDYAGYNRDTVIKVELEKCRLVREMSKGQWIPSQQVKIFSLIIDTVKAQVIVPEGKIVEVKQLMLELVGKKKISARKLASVAGKIQSLNRAFAHAKISEQAREDAKWVAENLGKRNGCPAWKPSRVKQVIVNASMVGWSAVFGDRRAFRNWSSAKLHREITRLEVEAVGQCIEQRVQAAIQQIVKAQNINVTVPVITVTQTPTNVPSPTTIITTQTVIQSPSTNYFNDANAVNTLIAELVTIVISTIKKKPQYNYQYRTPTLPKQPINNPPAIPYVRPSVNLQRLPHQVIIDRDVQQRLNQGYRPPNLALPRPPLKPFELKKYIPKRRK